MATIYDFITSKLGPNDTFFDVGANKGDVSKAALAKCGTVVAVEANPEHLKTLREIPNLLVVGSAASDKPGTVPFYLDTRKDMQGLASSLMVIQSLHKSGDAKELMVTADTIDNIVAKIGVVPTVIKVDTEGHEPAVVAGATKTISKHRPTLILEMWETHFPRYRPMLEMLSKTYTLTKLSDGQDAMAFYLAGHNPQGVEDIVATPR